MVNQFQSLKLKLLNVGYAKLDNRWNFNDVISPFSRLYLITRGNAFVYHNNQKFELQPGYMYLVPSYTYSSYKCEDMHEQFYVSFLEELGNGLSIYDFVEIKYKVQSTKLDEVFFKKLLNINPERTLINNDPSHYENRLKLMEFEKRNLELSSAKYLETLGILKVLLSKFVNEKMNSERDRTIKPKFDNILKHISENLHHKISIKELAQESNLSIDHFSKSFKKYMGLSPSQYIQEKRVERALLLLLTTNLLIKEIAIAIGFENHRYFSKFFKEKTGKTPYKFRSENMLV